MLTERLAPWKLLNRFVVNSIMFRALHPIKGCGYGRGGIGIGIGHGNRPMVRLKISGVDFRYRLPDGLLLVRVTLKYVRKCHRRGVPEQGSYTLRQEL